MRSISAAGWKSAYDGLVNPGTNFFDGRTAARNEVALRFEAKGVRIAGGPVDQFWPYDEIRYASLDPDDRPLVFRCQSSPVGASRLTIGDEATIESLRARCADLEDRVRRKRQRMRGTALAAAGIVSLSLIVWSSIHFLPRLVAPLVPVEWEEALGDAVVGDIADIFGGMAEGEVKRCETADGRLGLDILLARLVDQVKTPYRFEIIVMNVDTVNALAVPGGRIVVFKKLLTDARSPDEVAGVLAHEMGHVISRHPTEAVARSVGISLVFNVLMGGLGSGAAGAAGRALVNSAYSRDAEREADSIALDILRRARISPKGFAAFFDRMSREEGAKAHALAFISSHPPSDERASVIRNATVANAEPALARDYWKAVKAICGRG